MTPDHGKSQKVRLWDVWILGPWLVYLAVRQRPLTDTDRLLLVGAGVGTVAYNARNYVRIAQLDEGPEPASLSDSLW